MEQVAKMLYLDALAWSDKEYPKQDFGESKDFKNWQRNHRKSFATFILKCENILLRSIAFQMYGNFEYGKITWESLYPSGNQKFKNVGDIE